MEEQTQNKANMEQENEITKLPDWIVILKKALEEYQNTKLNHDKNGKEHISNKSTR
jgi:hypothetical protein